MLRPALWSLALFLFAGCNAEPQSQQDANTADETEAISVSYHRPVFSPDGMRIVFMMKNAATQDDWELFIADADGGNAERLTTHKGWDGYASFSPDGKYIVFDRDDGDDVKYSVVMNLDNGAETSLSRAEGWTAMNRWAPDGSGFYGFWEKDGQRDLYSFGLDGTPLDQITSTPGISEHDAALSADGSKLYFASEYGDGKGTGLEMIDLTTGERTQLASSTGRIYGTDLSPDGTIISYTDDTPGGENDDAEIYFLTLATGDIRQMTDNEHWDHMLVWRPAGGDSLFSSYRTGEERIYRMNTETGETAPLYPE